MLTRPLALVVPLVLATAACGQPSRPEKLSVNELSQEVAALEVIHQFQFTPDQLKALQKLAPETADAAGPRQAAKASAAFRSTLLRLRAALASGEDEDAIADLQDELDTLREKEAPDLDDSFELTEPATDQAPKLLKRLSSRQVAGYVALYGDDFPDPLEILLDALDEARGAKDEEWMTLRGFVAEEVGRLVGGLDADKARRAGDRAVQLLIQARSLSDGEFKAQRPALEKEARTVAGAAGPLEVVRNVLEQALAELLSNPRLGPALAARLAGQ